MAHEIECIINPDGSVEMEALGYQGQGCEEMLKKLAEALGDDKAEIKHKDEYFETEINVDQEQNVQGF